MKHRSIQKATKRARKEEWKRRLHEMSEAERKAYNENRIRTAESGYAKRQRERANGDPMMARDAAWHAPLVARDMKLGYASLSVKGGARYE
jgi:hypothetical protein